MSYEKLALHIKKQLDFFSYDVPSQVLPISTVIKPSLNNLMDCLSFDKTITNASENDFEKSIKRVIENSDYYSMLLTILSRHSLTNGLESEAWKIFALNKSLHSINISPNVVMPYIFRIAHSVGTVIGRAELKNFLFVGHGCTIGASGKNDEYPILGERVSLRANCQVLGSCILGDNIIIGTGVTLINEMVASNTIVVNDCGKKKYISSDHPLNWSIKKFSNI